MLRMLTILTVIATLALFVAAAFAEDTITPGPGPGAGPQAGPPEGGPPPGRPPRGPDRFFRRHDADKDGKVTLAELLAAAKQMLDDVDANEDGAITPEELEAHHRAPRAQRPPREGDQGPDEGQRPEGRRGPGGEGRGPEGRQRPSPEDRFKRLDENEDGVLSLEEFKAGARPERPPR